MKFKVTTIATHYDYNKVPHEEHKYKIEFLESLGFTFKSESSTRYLGWTAAYRIEEFVEIELKTLEELVDFTLRARDEVIFNAHEHTIKIYDTYCE